MFVGYSHISGTLRILCLPPYDNCNNVSTLGRSSSSVIGVQEDVYGFNLTPNKLIRWKIRSSAMQPVVLDLPIVFCD